MQPVQSKTREAEKFAESETKKVKDETEDLDVELLMLLRRRQLKNL